MISYKIERVMATRPYLQVHVMLDDDAELAETASELQAVLSRRFEGSNPPGKGREVIAHEKRTS
jgi:hypothetical protein